MILIPEIVFISELLKVNIDSNFVIDIQSFNTLSSRLRKKKILLSFSYSDIEDYALSIPSIASVERSRIFFKVNKVLVKEFENISKYYFEDYDANTLAEILRGMKK